MKPYHKIPTLWKRDPENKYKTLIEDEWASPELGYLYTNDWLWYEKVDGTNVRVTFFPETDCIVFNGRKDLADKNGERVEPQLHPGLRAALEERFVLDFFYCNFDVKRGNVITVYGEGFGPKIQKGGGNYVNTQDFCLFDIKIDDWWMPQEFVTEIAESALLWRAPLVAIGPLKLAIASARQGFNSDWGDFPAEGYVVRPLVDLFDRYGNRIIGKIKTRDFPNE